MPPKWWPPNRIPPKRIPPKCPNPPPLKPPPKCPPKRDCAGLDHRQSAPRLIMISPLANPPGIPSSTVTGAPQAHDRDGNSVSGDGIFTIIILSCRATSGVTFFAENGRALSGSDI